LGRRLQRILLLLPYAIRHPGATVDELSRKFGVQKSELIADLDLVFMCGLPGYGPGDLIEVGIDSEGGVDVRMADYFAAPLRLTAAEAISLYAGAEALLNLPGMEEADALGRAVRKLGRALGTPAAGGPGGITVELSSPARHLETLRQALAERRRVHMEYYAAARGEMTSRDVDPWGLIGALGHWYLVAWDHLREDERMFRVDRIKSAEILGAAAEVPDDFEPERYGSAFSGRGERRVVFEISPEVASWFGEYYPVEASEELPDGWRRVTLVTGGDRWAATLLLQLGEGARTVEPQAVLEESKALAASLAARHS
jgi:proteasome accessory factor C